MYPAKFIFGIFILLCSPPFPVTGEAELDSGVKAVLTHDGLFQGRLRLESDLLRLSLVSSFDGGVPEYIEPCLRTGFFSAGRLNLKGAVREFYSTSSLSAGAGVLTELSGISVTDSFSRTSRWGGFLTTETPAADVPGPDFWAFRTNSGELSAGMIFDSLPLVKTKPLHLEADILASAGRSPGEEAGAWFAGSAMLPPQEVLNFSAELRGAVRAQGAGRRVMAVRSDDFSTAASVAADISLPLITAAGISLRGFASFGNRTLSVSAFIDTNDENFISPSGERSDDALGWGCRLLLCGRGEWDTELSGEYNFYLNHPGLVPGRVLEQEEKAELSAAIETDFFRLSLNGDYKRSYDGNGISSGSGGGELKLYGESEGLRLGTELRIRSESLEAAAEKTKLRMKTLLRLRQQRFSAELITEWNGCLTDSDSPADDIRLELELSASAERYRVEGRLFTDIEYPGAALQISPGFSLSFESF